MSKLAKQQEQLEATQCVASMLIGEKMTIYVVVRKVAASGMSRTMSLLVLENGRLRDITYLVHQALQWPLCKDGYLRVSGCGMDMGFYAVDALQTCLKKAGVECNLEYKFI